MSSDLLERARITETSLSVDSDVVLVLGYYHSSFTLLSHENLQNKNRHAGHVQRHGPCTEELQSLLPMGDEVRPRNEEW